MDSKMIVEAIIDKVYNEGGCVNVWIKGAKLRHRVWPYFGRIFKQDSEVEGLTGMAEFKPSEMLSEMIRSHAHELREYLEKLVREWGVDCSNWHTPAVGSSLEGAIQAPPRKRSGNLRVQRGFD